MSAHSSPSVTARSAASICPAPLGFAQIRERTYETEYWVRASERVRRLPGVEETLVSR